MRQLLITSTAAVILLALAGCDRPNSAAPAGTPVAPSPAPPAAARVLADIPEAYVGEWNADLAACGSGVSDNRLRIEADKVRFYESIGEVKSVERRGERELAVKLEMSGEGQKWASDVILQLAPDGQSLTTLIDGAGLTRKRCPVTES